MALITQGMKGTQDLLPADSAAWQFAENTISKIAENYGFREIRTPVFEHTELFQRSVGDTTDVVQKEMYTFNDKGGRSITLRPEGTAGAVRAFLEHGLFNEPSPMKVYYHTSCYRYEKPQAGRLREFHQFGVECFGSGHPAQDAELISLANDIFFVFGIDNLELQLNSIGCPDCRPKYQEALREYFGAHVDELCEDCKGRLDRNPMRIVDCKCDSCAAVSKDAPVITDYLCDECSVHFESVQKYLKGMGIPYIVNPKIVRGLDYYTKTVFEFVSNEIGAQGTVLGGGRYDGLCDELGGRHVPALGFAMGMERLMLLLEAKGIELPSHDKPAIYIAPVGEAASIKAAVLARDIRNSGMEAHFDTMGKSIRAQMKYANKIDAIFSVVIGDNELEEGTVKVKEMETGEEYPLNLEDFVEEFMDLYIDRNSIGLSDALNGMLEGIDWNQVDISEITGGEING